MRIYLKSSVSHVEKWNHCKVEERPRQQLLLYSNIKGPLCYASECTSSKYPSTTFTHPQRNGSKWVTGICLTHTSSPKFNSVATSIAGPKCFVDHCLHNRRKMSENVTGTQDECDQFPATIVISMDIVITDMGRSLQSFGVFTWGKTSTASPHHEVKAWK